MGLDTLVSACSRHLDSTYYSHSCGMASCRATAFLATACDTQTIRVVRIDSNEIPCMRILLIKALRVSVSDTFLTLSPSKKNYVSRSIRSIFHAALNKDPSIVREILDLPQFAALQTEVIVHNQEEDTTHSLSHFFNALVDHYHIAIFDDVPPPVSELAYYLSLSPFSDLKLVVDHALAILSSYTHPNATDELRRIVTDHPALARNDLIHPTLPVLLLIGHLSEESKDAICLFVESGIVDVIGELCANNFPDLGREPAIQREYAPSALRLACCILLAHIYAVFPGSIRHLRSTNPHGFFDIFPWMMDYCHSTQLSYSTVSISYSQQLQNTFYEELFELFFLPCVFSTKLYEIGYLTHFET